MWNPWALSLLIYKIALHKIPRLVLRAPTRLHGGSRFGVRIAQPAAKR